MTSDSFRYRLRAWGRRQMYSFFSSLGTLLGHRLGTFMTVTVIGIAMSMPLGLYVSVTNLRAVDLQQGELGSVSVFLSYGLSSADASALAGKIDQSGLGTVQKIISPEEGLAEFQQRSGWGSGLNALEDNPLPWVLQVIPVAAEVGTGQGASDLAAWLEPIDGVDLVQVDTLWLRRLDSLLDLVNAVVAVLGVLFSLAVIVVVANTIRLDVAARFEEIQVMSLVGASDSFIRQPFLYSGFWYGLLGGLLALMLLNLSMLYLQLPLGRLLEAYGNAFETRGLGLANTLLVLVAGGGLGLLGAWVSVQRHLGLLKRGALASI